MLVLVMFCGMYICLQLQAYRLTDYDFDRYQWGRLEDAWTELSAGINDSKP